MECKICQKNLEVYSEGKLTSDISYQIKTHLNQCSECAEKYQLLTITEKVITKEKETLSNPFLSTRIMSAITELENTKVPIYRRTLQPILLAASITIAVVFGVLAGSLYKPAKAQNIIPEELVYINDAGLESLAIYDNQ